MPTSYYSSFGYSLGFFSYLTGFFSYFYLTTGADDAAPELAVDPPKLKKSEMFFPATALANNFPQYPSTSTPDAEIKLFIFYAE